MNCPRTSTLELSQPPYEAPGVDRLATALACQGRGVP